LLSCVTVNAEGCIECIERLFAGDRVVELHFVKAQPAF
jgi:hypothetical protein